MATYQISSGTTIPQLKDGPTFRTLFETSFNANTAQKIDLKYGANNNDALIRYNNTLFYDASLSYTTTQINHNSKVITITNTSSSIRSGAYNYSSNSFYPTLVSNSYNLFESTGTKLTFAPNFSTITFY